MTRDAASVVRYPTLQLSDRVPDSLCREGAFPLLILRLVHDDNVLQDHRDPKSVPVLKKKTEKFSDSEKSVGCRHT